MCWSASTIVLVGLLAAALPACSDRPTTYFKCTVCLVDDATRCATYTPACGDSPDQMSSQAGAKDALCDALTTVELAHRPTPTGFAPNTWLKNACYAWPAEAFKTSCTTFSTTCASVPIH